jgi:hypothetical protein
MAQIIRHRRGSLEALSAVTSSLQKGELIIASGSSNLSVNNGASIVFAVAEAGQVQAVNRVLRGTNAPSNFASSTYNGLVDGVPYYASGSSTLYLLGSDGNEAINLIGNIQPFSTSVDSRLDSLEASIGGGTGIGARVSALEATSASLNSFTQSFSQSVATDFSASAATTAGNLSSYSSSAASAQNSYSSSAATSLSASAASINASILTLSTSVDSRLDAVENTNATQATTGSNIFYGNQTITGSLYITQNLVVQGSSSLQNITASAVDIGTNTIILNNATPAVRFGGISVQDSGSFAGVSGSLLWDSFNNHWLYVQPSGAAEEYNSAILIAGPKNTGAIGGEIGITEGYIPVAVGENHIGDSNISIVDGTIVSIAGTLEVSGDISGSTIAGLGNATAYSTSVDSRLGTVEASLGGGGSIGSRVSNLEAHSASIVSFTSSYFTDSASFDTRIDNVVSDLNSVSGAVATSLSASKVEYTSFSASAASNLSSVSGAFATTISNLGSTYATDSELSSVSGAFATSISASAASQTQLSSSIATTIANLGDGFATDSELSSLSSSIATRDAGQDTTINNLSSSANARLTSLENKSGSLATTGSNTFIGTQTVSGSVNVSGSANFNGAVAVNDSNMNLTNSSSLNLTAGSSIYVAAGGTISGSISGIGNVSAFSSSVDSRLLTNVNAAAGAFASASAYSGSLASTINTLSTSVDSRLDSLESAVGGGSNIDNRLSALEATSASLEATASNHEGRIDTLESFSGAFNTAFDLDGQNVTIAGDLIVNGTTTTVNSTTIELGDNIIALNGSGASNGGLLVKDVTNPNKVSGSLLWDSTGDYWKAGALGAEHKILTVNDGVVSGSSQITLSSTTGYSTFSSSVATSISSSNANISSLSASVASVTGDFSSSVATSFSASNASITSLSASVASVTGDFSSSVATSFSASAASVTALSSSVASNLSTFSQSVDSRLDVLEGNVGQALNTDSNVTFNSVTASVNLGSTAGNTKRIAFRNTNGNLDLVPTASVAGDLLQWNGNDFVMSNVIDGGSF